MVAVIYRMHRCLYRNKEAWQRINANSLIYDWITNGVRLPFLNIPQEFEITNKKFTVRESTFITEEIQRLQETGAIVECSVKPLCISPIIVVPKKHDKLRLVTDLRCVNEYLSCPYFRNEGIDVVSQYIRYNDVMCSIDLKNGYHHIPVHPSDQKYLGFAWDQKYFVWQVCPFGLSISGYCFNKCIRAVVEYLRVQGLRIIFFVDDGIIFADRGSITDHCDTLIHTLQELGFTINFEKSELHPQTKLQWIGYNIDSVGENNEPWLSIPRQRIQKLRHDICRILNAPFHGIKAKGLARITGQCIAMCKAVLPAKLKLRNLYKILRIRNSWHDTLYLDASAIEDLKWWYHALYSWNGAPAIRKEIDVQIETDASGYGWGAKLGDKCATGIWDKCTSLKSSNYRELLAIILAIKSFAQCLKNKRVQVLTDNITCVANINKLGGPCIELSKLAQSLWALAFDLNIDLTAKHLAGKLNVQADYLSRLLSPHEWKLHRNMFRYIDSHFGPHTIDRFASLRTAQLPRYNSLWWDPGSEAIDAMAQDWSQENNFINAPFKLIPRILRKIQEEKAVATIIAPDWPAQPWYRTLLRMTTHTLPLPNSPKTVMRLGTIPEPLRNRRWRLFAWRICG